MKTLTIIDTFGFFFRNYYALPSLTNSQGFPTGLLTGFANFILGLQQEHDTDYVLFALDSKGKNFRHAIDPNYKANRPDAPEDLKKQLPVAVSWIRKMGFKECEVSGFEADDVIASAVKFAKHHDLKVRIVSHDKDLYQLIEDGIVTIYDPMKKIEIDSKKCYEKFGCRPDQVRDYLALVGDTADNIPGVRGIGPKGAKKLLDEFGTLDGIYENLEKVANPRNKTLLEEGKESAFMSKALTSLDYSIDISDRFESFRFPVGNPLVAIRDELEALEMGRILRRIGTSSVPAPVVKEVVTFEPILVDTPEMLDVLVDALSAEHVVAFDTETDSLDTSEARLVGFSFACDESKAYYVPVAHSYLGVGPQISLEEAKKAIEKIFTCKVVGQNLKYDLKVVEHNFGITPCLPYADTMLMGWLLEPSFAVGLDAMAKRFFEYEMVKFKEVVGKGQTFANVPLEEACKYAAEDAWMTLKLYNKLSEMLDPSLLDIAKAVEYPFILTLMKMENEGIKVDTSFLASLLKSTEVRLGELTKNIYALAKTEFNINSVKQLGIVLFEQLQLPVIKKTKTGYSTDENVLSELKDAHEIVPKLLEYRELYKLKSTYLEPLLKLGLATDDARVHTSFLQTGTATGRLSSKDPNLQNIPVRTELGREVRKGFIAKVGYKLVGIDYSQIELRLLAHFSQDAALVDAFKENKDIHTETAVKLFGEEEAASKRNIAKSINFGLLYGMGARKLGQTLGIPSKEAKGYIDSYFALFPTVKRYMESIQQTAKNQGYVETLLGRRRYFDYAKATPMLQAAYERESVNTVFQGSAADLIKLSMLKIMETLVDDEAKLLLQIHDELIFEVKEEHAAAFSKKASACMENIYTLAIPLKTSISIGDNWGELK